MKKLEKIQQSIEGVQHSMKSIFPYYESDYVGSYDMERLVEILMESGIIDRELLEKKEFLPIHRLVQYYHIQGKENFYLAHELSQEQKWRFESVMDSIRLKMIRLKLKKKFEEMVEEFNTKELLEIGVFSKEEISFQASALEEGVVNYINAHQESESV